ncbi:(2Fe-2S)-binding protein [Candidatus Methylospira mobilis]|uniref:(2Fe-2S)-binding protein n=1 Tax=Candidatus Methylospira mobilis TaxID=1808979 RepID=A0A5Q0BP33_9GAMM|nr:(2Fe-2S)-binding protein [Candidatus Methylospira mobilis]QFY44031.1 (2Fe-2S)-binding protein [Candidatus Methylospira mobilis]WNV05035.1 (2Fe-2S)-binding protein [Candidatus Methylospira mobilis]
MLITRNIVCRCSGTTEEQISKLVDHGIDDLESLSRATGGCSGCGACDADIMALLARLSPCNAGGNLRGKTVSSASF